ncbi:hypothetical protein IE53DRAFT_383764 [Violaceomyces palustris]|uniref:Uncharacterized protein n=1 Tax=Violaceomyces palustris TaxID=1673888 RepID=A0ACD0P6D7_9BASI|nr:hypothetical protein IE53DRAFT_383764 [Violaceomyces palustris]
MVSALTLLRVVAPLAPAIWFFPNQVRADCECGYLDPATDALWTDATISYFNETGAADFVNQTALSPRIYGEQTAGDTGNGTQNWAVVGNHINKWENDFSATFLSAVSFNNTYFDDQRRGLAMQVSQADMKARIVNGSQIVTRRRDILYGSFRASILPGVPYGYGAAFKFGVSYNESETVDTGLYIADDPHNSTLRWSYSASGQDADPIKTNVSYFNTNYLNMSYLGSNDFIEHRMDWLSNKILQFRNNAPNDTVNFRSFVKGVNSTNLPTMPAPVSLQAWANGEKSQSMGPPIYQPLVTRIMYTRFFFNSSLPERHGEFVAQCTAAAGPRAVCSTEDHTLRSSTPFTPLSLERVAPYTVKFKVPLYAIIIESIFGGLVVIIIAHGLFVRRMSAKQKKLAEEAAATSSQAEDRERTSSGSSPVAGSASTSMIFGTASFDFSKPLNPQERPISQLWDVPHLVNEFNQDDSDDEGEDDVDPFVDTEEQLGRLAPLEDLEYLEDDDKEARSTLPTFATGRNQPVDGVATPTRAYQKPGSLPYIAPSYASSLVHGETDSRTSLNLVNGVGSFDASSIHSSGNDSSAQLATGRGSWQQQRPQILRWRKRNVSNDGDVGELAQPAIGDRAARRLSVVSNNNNRQSAMFAGPPLGLIIVNKIWDFFFVEGSSLTTSTGDKRIDYLDGLRGFACLLVSMGHFVLIFYYGVADWTGPHHYRNFEFWLRVILAPIIINAGMLLGIFFVMPSRTMCLRYLMKGGLQSMADSTVRRMPRLILPVAGAVLANYFLMDVNAFKWVPRLASRTWSIWSYWQNFENVIVFVNAFISLWYTTPPTSPALVTGYATGVLWTIPVIIQGMWTCVLTALIAYEIKNAYKRFTFYGFCVFFSWYANSWDLFFMSGLIVADLDAKMGYRDWSIPIIHPAVHRFFGVPRERAATKWRIHIRIFAWLFFLACAAQQYLGVIPNGPGSLFDLYEYGIHPDFTNSKTHGWNDDLIFHYTNPRFASWCLVMSMFMLADLSPVFRVIFKLKFWAFMGKHSLAYFLCHGVIFWSWGAWLCVTMLAAGAPYWATILVVFFTSYSLLTILCVCFTYTFEYWGILLSKSVWRATSGGYGRKV